MTFGLLDVTDVLADPDLCAAFIVIRGTKGRDSNNRGTVTPSAPIQAFGSIQPASSRDLIRMPDAESLKGSYVIYTTFALTAGDGTYAADIVQCDGRQFTVVTLDNWAFGAGYTKAFAQMLDLT